jgi:predicted CoA-binding protein
VRKASFTPGAEVGSNQGSDKPKDIKTVRIAGLPTSVQFTKTCPPEANCQSVPDAAEFTGRPCRKPRYRDSAIMKTVAIIGASNDRGKFGNKAVRAFVKQGFTVYPVHPSEAVVEGLPAYPTIADVPRRPEQVSVYVPPPILLKLLPDIAAKGCDELWLNPGTESPAVLAEAERLGLNVIRACSIVAAGVSPASL